MSQYCSRIHIKVSSPGIWKKFSDEYDADLHLAELAEGDTTSFAFGGEEWSVTEDELKEIVSGLAGALGKNGIIISDTTNINVDEYNYCVYYFGDKIHTACFQGGSPKRSMFYETDIDDLPEWLSYGGFRVSKAESKVLFTCGYVSIDGTFEEFSTDLQIPDRILLRETSFKKRPAIIEKAHAGEEVYFVHAADSYDPLRLEVMSEQGSLGYLPSDVSDQLTPFLINDHLCYVAKTETIIPASKRNKNAKSSIVVISIQAEVSCEETPMVTKETPEVTSVSKSSAASDDNGQVISTRSRA